VLRLVPLLAIPRPQVVTKRASERVSGGMLASPIENHRQTASNAGDADLIRQFRQGCDTSAAALHARYARRVRSLVEQNWPSSLRSRCDPEDIVQDVFGRFFGAVQRGIRLAPEESGIWKFLLVVTLNQVRKTAARHLSARRDVRQTVVQGLGWFCENAGHSAAVQESHSSLVVDELLESMPLPMRRVVERRLAGFTVPEIARDLTMSQRAAERLMQSVRRHVGEFLKLTPVPKASPLPRLRKAAPPSPNRARNLCDQTRQVKIA
jgi:DNA-directed RNA polymerase specialized sigma24 family protein